MGRMTKSTRSKPEKATNRLPEHDRRAKVSRETAATPSDHPVSGAIGAAGGAAAGAVAGALGGPAGMAAGAVAGGVLGSMAGAKAGKRIDEAVRSPGPRDDADLRNDPETQDTPRSE